MRLCASVVHRFISGCQIKPSRVKTIVTFAHKNTSELYSTANNNNNNNNIAVTLVVVAVAVVVVLLVVVIVEIVVVAAAASAVVVVVFLSSLSYSEFFLPNHRRCKD
jgi:Flp pilus assembly protein TadB